VLDLADALAGQPELFAHLFERMSVPIAQAKAQTKDARLAGGESAHHLLQGFAKELLVRYIGGGQRLVILDKVPELGIPVIAHRPLQGYGIAGNPQ